MSNTILELPSTHKWTHKVIHYTNNALRSRFLTLHGNLNIPQNTFAKMNFHLVTIYTPY